MNEAASEYLGAGNLRKAILHFALVKFTARNSLDKIIRWQMWLCTVSSNKRENHGENGTRHLNYEV